MIDLTTQQQAILTEGICPLCQHEVDFVAFDPDKPSQGNVWTCIGCQESYQITDTNDRPYAVIEHRCQQCGNQAISVAPVNTHFLERGNCGHFNEVD